jgi:hypothetical protein
MWEWWDWVLKLGNAEKVAIVALIMSTLTALLSYFCALRSANAAKAANKIQLHSHQKELYSAVIELSHALASSGPSIGFDRIREHGGSIQFASLYVSKSLSVDLDKFYTMLLEIPASQSHRDHVYEMIRMYAFDKDAENLEKYKKEGDEINKKILSLIVECSKLGSVLKGRLNEEIKLVR